MTSLVLDTSAVVAILQSEPEAERLVEALEVTSVRRISAASILEAGIVLQARWGDHGERELDLLIQRAGIQVIPVSAAHAELGRRAFRRFGKGRHPAGLNFGDCFSYALATTLDDPLLYVGTDFPQTDVAPALV